ncbi:ABC transporter permease [Lactococcus protaetiae]|uniref:ABC transporter permease n=1 Tax=Lactococcus protaetiae TaxID=2592653 RepID=A0A514Z7Q1_9LACT|nr:ABC transporter permease [Lactococcus protaetiae]MCL2114563.1 ABC transporter permease [Streptococcaceae bacterium]QDK70583.1 ABC transporter permease [Lactococcus protaetiae]
MLVKYILKRVLLMVLTLFLVITATFFLMQVMPGTPFNNPKLSPDQVHALMITYGLDKPLWQQYLIYLGHAFTGNFGTSFTYMNQPVSMMIAQRLPVSAQLGVEAMIIAIVFGVLFGVLSARYRNTWVDGLLSVISTFAFSVPSFVVGTLLLLLFGYTLNVLPVTGWDGFGASTSVMPAIALSLASMAQVTAFVRSEMIESLSSDYILLARAKGLSSNEVLWKHALRNSLIPMLTLIGPMTAALLTGSVLIETIFSIPGIGQQFVQSIPSKDFPVIMGTTIVYAAMLMIMILVTDIITAFVDPRVRLD